MEGPLNSKIEVIFVNVILKFSSLPLKYTSVFSNLPTKYTLLFSSVLLKCSLNFKHTFQVYLTIF